MTQSPSTQETFRFSTEIVTRNADLLDMFELWSARRGDRPMPLRADMTPEAMKRHLGWLHLIDVSYDPLDFRFRLYGSSIAELLGKDSTGKTFSEAFPEPFLSQVRPAFEYSVKNVAPLLLSSTGAGANKDFIAVTSLLLPLSDNGDVVDVILVRHTIDAG